MGVYYLRPGQWGCASGVQAMRIQARVGYSPKPRVGRVEKTENLCSVIVLVCVPHRSDVGAHCGTEL